MLGNETGIFPGGCPLGTHLIWWLLWNCCFHEIWGTLIAWRVKKMYLLKEIKVRQENRHEEFNTILSIKIWKYIFRNLTHFICNCRIHIVVCYLKNACYSYSVNATNVLSLRVCWVFLLFLFGLGCLGSFCSFCYFSLNFGPEHGMGSKYLVFIL